MPHILKSDIKEIKYKHELSKKDIKVFANILAVSFKNYPLFEYFSSNKYSVKKMRTFFEVSLKTMPPSSIFITDSEKVNSLAIFLPCENSNVFIWNYLKAGGIKILFTLGIKGVSLMTKFENFALEIKNKYLKPGSRYFYYFVTMPEYRGQGIGAKLLKEMVEYLDQKHEDCYLETLLPLNVEIYKRYGFILKEEAKIPGTDLTLYAMLREAK